MSVSKINIAVAGGQCTGKSTLSAALFFNQKIKGYDFDLIGEESRKLKSEFGDYKSPFERFYMWRQQQREEDRSTAVNGFVTDTPLFHFYISARMHSTEPRDNLAVRELFRMCLEQENRYQLIAIADNPEEIPYKFDSCRQGERERAIMRHNSTRSFIDHFFPKIILPVSGSVEERVKQVNMKLEEMRRIEL